jgi:chaperone BCS1
LRLKSRKNSESFDRMPDSKDGQSCGLWCFGNIQEIS